MDFTQAIFSFPAYFGNTSHTAMKQKYMKGLRKSKNFMTKEDFSGKRISLCTNPLGFGHTERGQPRRAAICARGEKAFELYYVQLHLPRQTEGGLTRRTSLDRGGQRTFVFWGQIFQAGSREWRKN
jgi:hypothetical protein